MAPKLEGAGNRGELDDTLFFSSRILWKKSVKQPRDVRSEIQKSDSSGLEISHRDEPIQQPNVKDHNWNKFTSDELGFNF